MSARVYCIHRGGSTSIAKYKEAHSLRLKIQMKAKIETKLCHFKGCVPVALRISPVWYFLGITPLCIVKESNAFARCHRTPTLEPASAEITAVVYIEGEHGHVNG